MPTLPPARLAIADDHGLVRAGFVRLLERAGHQVVLEADHGLHLLEQLPDAGPLDVVFVDLSMPVLDGYKLLGRLATEWPQLPAVVMTLHNEDEHILRSMRAGAKGYYCKSDAPGQLVEAVHQVRTTGTYITPGVLRCLQAHPDGRTPAERAREAALAEISERELEVLQRTLGPDEPTMAKVGDHFDISERTVETHLRNMARKAGVKTRTGLALGAMRLGLVPHEGA